MEAKKKAGNALFVTGTGTDVGKTVVTSLLLGFLLEKGIQATYQKWVSTGGENPQDLLYCREHTGFSLNEAELDSHVPFRFKMAASPHLAAEKEGKDIGVEKIRQVFYQLCQENELVLVEGVGGIFVPLRRDLLLADFLIPFKMPTLVVAGSGLGTINHSLLTIEALRQRSIPVLGIVLSDEQEHMPSDDPIVTDNMKILAELGGVEVFGRLPRLSDYAALQDAFQPIGEKISERMNTL
ncbi:MAG: dethiobiotin synthase [Desulfobulbaceae bacterium]|nr:dethiobiotin synthase [Desulfobulbaceae bacterium]